MAETPGALPAPVSPSAPIGGTETILLLEDADGVRNLSHRILERHGYTVLQARHGEEAIEVSEHHRGPIHILVTDVVMPKLGGRALAQRLAEARRELKVLYMSGYSDEAVVPHGVLDPGTASLQKLFSPEALLRKVREVLAKAREAP